MSTITISPTANEILQHFRKWGGRPSDWYVGIASDPEARLFSDHNVNRNGDVWYFKNCGSAAVARSIEQELLAYGFDGGPGGGDNYTRFIYAYKKASYTRE